MHGLILRGIDTRTYAAIRKYSKLKHKSMNRLILEIVRCALGTKPQKENKELEQFIGTWPAKESEKFRTSLKVFEHIDQDMWQ